MPYLFVRKFYQLISNEQLRIVTKMAITFGNAFPSECGETETQKLFLKIQCDQYFHGLFQVKTGLKYVTK